MKTNLLAAAACLLILASLCWSQDDAAIRNWKKLAPYFQPPAALANDFGSFRSPLKFDDGSAVKTADDWHKRRQEIRTVWHEFLGRWPAIVEKPKIEYLSKERRENFTQYHVRIQIDPKRFTEDAYLLVPDGDGPFPAAVVVFYDAKTGIGQGNSPILDFAYQLAKRGFVTLSIGGNPGSLNSPNEKNPLQPLSYLEYKAAICWHILANLPYVDAARIGIVGHSYGGKWASWAFGFVPVRRFRLRRLVRWRHRLRRTTRQRQLLGAVVSRL